MYREMKTVALILLHNLNGKPPPLGNRSERLTSEKSAPQPTPFAYVCHVKPISVGFGIHAKEETQNFKRSESRFNHTNDRLCLYQLN